MQERDDNHTCRVIIYASNSACAVLQISAHTIVVSRAESSRNSFSDFLQSSENPLKSRTSELYNVLGVKSIIYIEFETSNIIRGVMPLSQIFVKKLNFLSKKEISNLLIIEKFVFVLYFYLRRLVCLRIICSEITDVGLHLKRLPDF